MKIDKSFRFTVRLGGRTQRAGTVAPPQSATEESFQPAAARYRRHLDSFVAAGVGGFFLSGLSLLVPEALFPWIAYPGVALVALSLLIFFTLPRLACPACGRSADGFADYCPACGAAGLKRRWLMGTRCNACNRSLGSYKYRNYKIRFCTHCGALLDNAGI